MVYNTMFLLTTTITGKDYIKILGFTVLNMNSELMEDELSKNDLIIVKSTNEKSLKEGDIIAYTVNGKTRINKIINTENGYTTKYNKSYYPDVEKIEYNQVIGKKIINIPFLGTIIKILQSWITGIIILIYFILAYINITNKEKRRKKKDKFLKREI